MSPELRRVLATFVFVVFAAVSVLAQTEARSNANAEPASAGSSNAAKNTPVNPKYTTPKSPLDTAYGAKIAEYTTEKYFMTELVDHLPLSDKVPSPEKVLGYAVGTPNKLRTQKICTAITASLRKRRRACGFWSRRKRVKKDASKCS